jgi:phosphoadenosine phosphosulfate reductase
MMTTLCEQLPRLQAEFEDSAPQAILRWAAATFGDRLAVVTSFQPSGIVILHLLQSIAPATTVITLDTGLLFPETEQLIDTIAQRFNLRLVRVRPEQTVQEQAQSYGDALWTRDPDRCCHLRKVLPLERALRGYAAWITGLRRDQSPQRAATEHIAFDPRGERIKIAPLARWTEAMVWAYLRAHDLPYNPLHDRGYPSIGCWPCTQPVSAALVDRRAGRWAGQGKTECGLHSL